MERATIICAVKGIGPYLASLVGSYLTLKISNRNLKQDFEKLRNQNSIPRKVVYDIFDELLLALRDTDKKSDDKIRSLYQKAEPEIRDATFLFDDDPKLQVLLVKIHNAVKHEVIDNEEDLELTAADILYDKSNPKLKRIAQHQEAKGKICNDFRAQLMEQFRPYLRLTDSSLRK